MYVTYFIVYSCFIVLDDCCEALSLFSITRILLWVNWIAVKLRIENILSEYGGHTLLLMPCSSTQTGTILDDNDSLKRLHGFQD